MLRRSTSLAVCAALSLGAGCSSSSSSGGQPTTGLGFTGDELCALVSQADVSAAVGTQVGPGVPSGVNAPSCSWQSADSMVGATIAASDPNGVGQIPFGLQGKPGAHVTAIANLGDAAFFASGASGPTAELDMRKGARAVTITVGNSRDSMTYTQAQQEASELAIAKVAVTKM